MGSTPTNTVMDRTDYHWNAFSAQLISLFEAIRLRIAAGSSFKAGPELGDDLHRLQIIDQNKPRKDKGISKWEIERNEIYKIDGKKSNHWNRIKYYSVDDI